MTAHARPQSTRKEKKRSHDEKMIGRKIKLGIIKIFPPSSFLH